jgi:hypothetical protein
MSLHFESVLTAHFSSVRPELVEGLNGVHVWHGEGPLMVRQAHHERPNIFYTPEIRNK